MATVQFIKLGTVTMPFSIFISVLHSLDNVMYKKSSS